MGFKKKKVLLAIMSIIMQSPEQQEDTKIWMCDHLTDLKYTKQKLAKQKEEIDKYTYWETSMHFSQ